MLLTTFQRRRLVVLSIVTIILFPILRACSGSNAVDSANSTTTIDPANSTIAPSSGVVSDEESPAPIILSGPAPIVQDGSAQIAYPATETSGIQLVATFSNFDNAPAVVCFVPAAPFGITLTIKNINNGRTTRCTNVYREIMPAGATALLHTKVFEAISNLVDAPIPVNVTW
ncbi:hypothetical protein EMGBS4_10830 [Acidimicrobiaceae bacterium]|nr:hypothetical protein EMGBS4_10830 [Acidimicrobiaceae bacterium]